MNDDEKNYHHRGKILVFYSDITINFQKQQKLELLDVTSIN